MSRYDPYELFDMIDLNHDGVIDHSELLEVVKMLGVSATAVEAIMDFADSDKNGTINREEFNVALSQQVLSSHIVPNLPPGSQVPTSNDILNAFSVFNSRKAPPGFIHVEDLRVALGGSLPLMERDAAKRRAAQQTKLEASHSRRNRVASRVIAERFTVADGLEERIEALIAGCGCVSHDGLINYASAVSLLYKVSER